MISKTLSLIKKSVGFLLQTNKLKTFPEHQTFYSVRYKIVDISKWKIYWDVPFNMAVGVRIITVAQNEKPEIA